MKRLMNEARSSLIESSILSKRAKLDSSIEGDFIISPNSDTMARKFSKSLSKIRRVILDFDKFDFMFLCFIVFDALLGMLFQVRGFI